MSKYGKHITAGRVCGNFKNFLDVSFLSKYSYSPNVTDRLKSVHASYTQNCLVTCRLVEVTDPWGDHNTWKFSGWEN
jgi:hypothetical protein